MAAYVKSTLYIPAFILCLIVYVNTNALALQDPYLKEYFTKAISLFEAQQYNESVLLFEKIIEIEKDKGEFYYSPFAEIYIEKSRNKNIVIVPQKKEAKGTLSNTAVGDTFRPRGRGHFPSEAKMESLESVPYRASVYDAALDNYEAKAIIPQKIDTPKEGKEPEVDTKIYEGLGSFSTTPHPEDPDPERSEGEGDEESLEILQPFGLQDDQSVSSQKNSPTGQIYSTFQWTINEKIENGLENLDNETLQFFEDQRFLDIVSEIKAYKRKR